MNTLAAIGIVVIGIVIALAGLAALTWLAIKTGG
jgi:hypothetical protein